MTTRTGRRPGMVAKERYVRHEWLDLSLGESGSGLGVIRSPIFFVVSFSVLSWFASVCLVSVPASAVANSYVLDVLSSIRAIFGMLRH